MALVTTPLLVSVDVVSASVALVGEVLGALALGVTPVQLLRRIWPIMVLAPLTGVSMLLYGRQEGREYFSFALAHVTDGSISLAIAITVRVVAVGLPAAVLSMRMDPTALGDGLAQLWRLPEKFVVSTVAALRMISLFQHDYAAMSRARRSRGLGDSGRIRRAATICFALLVMALRRGAKLATAMEARGFGAPGPRTWARESRLYPRDWVLMAGALLIAVVALVAASVTGYLRFMGA